MSHRNDWCYRLLLAVIVLSYETTLVAQDASLTTAKAGQETNATTTAKRRSEVENEHLQQSNQLAIGQNYRARDSLNCIQDETNDANECLSGLVWQPTEFQVELQEGSTEHKYHRLVRFDSARPQGHAVNDRVAMEWHIARDPQGKPTKAPAMVVVHESGSGMVVGRLIAKGLYSQGIHTFMLQMPGYGERKSGLERDVTNFIPSLKQAVADVRRARDAVAALPLVDTERIGVQGTSLGGFVTANVAGVDTGFHRYFILLAGGDLKEVLLNGSKDAAKVRQRLENAGVTQEMIIEHARQIEPLRLAHRVQSQHTWLYSGKYDDVVPPACSHAFARAAKLPEGHHIEMPVDHYSGIVLMPKIIGEMASLLRD